MQRAAYPVRGVALQAAVGQRQADVAAPQAGLLDRRHAANAVEDGADLREGLALEGAASTPGFGLGGLSLGGL